MSCLCNVWSVTLESTSASVQNTSPLPASSSTHVGVVVFASILTIIIILIVSEKKIKLVQSS